MTTEEKIIYNCKKYVPREDALIAAFPVKNIVVKNNVILVGSNLKLAKHGKLNSIGKIIWKTKEFPAMLVVRRHTVLCAKKKGSPITVNGKHGLIRIEVLKNTKKLEAVEKLPTLVLYDIPGRKTWVGGRFYEEVKSIEIEGGKIVASIEKMTYTGKWSTIVLVIKAWKNPITLKRNVSFRYGRKNIHRTDTYTIRF